MPIQLSLIRELKTILEEDYNLNLSMEETTEIAVRLVGFVETLLKIESKNQSRQEREVEFKRSQK